MRKVLALLVLISVFAMACNKSDVAIADAAHPVYEYVFTPSPVSPEYPSAGYEVKFFNSSSQLVQKKTTKPWSYSFTSNYPDIRIWIEVEHYGYTGYDEVTVTIYKNKVKVEQKTGHDFTLVGEY